MIEFKRAIVEWLKTRAMPERWEAYGMGAYLDPCRWIGVDYQEQNSDAQGKDWNIRVFGLSGASSDGKQSGQIRVISDAGDCEIHTIEAVMPVGANLSNAQHDFIALTRLEAPWVFVAEDPEFGSW